jgi:hypothetical protein
MNTADSSALLSAPAGRCEIIKFTFHVQAVLSDFISTLFSSSADRLLRLCCSICFARIGSKD